MVPAVGCGEGEVLTLSVQWDDCLAHAVRVLENPHDVQPGAYDYCGVWPLATQKLDSYVLE